MWLGHFFINQKSKFSEYFPTNLRFLQKCLKISENYFILTPTHSVHWSPVYLPKFQNEKTPPPQPRLWVKYTTLRVETPPHGMRCKVSSWSSLPMTDYFNKFTNFWILISVLTLLADQSFILLYSFFFSFYLQIYLVEISK